MLGGELGVTSGTIGGEISLPVTPPVGTPVSPPPAAAIGIYHAGPDLLMVAGSRTTIAMDANKAGFDGLFATQNKTKRGALHFGPGGYWFREELNSASLCAITLQGAGGIELYESENHFGPNAFGGSGSRLIAGESGLDHLLGLTAYGAKLDDLTFQGGWRQAVTDSVFSPQSDGAHSPPGTLLLFKSNPGGNTFGTGKCELGHLALVLGADGITFAEHANELNADNYLIRRLEGQYMSGALLRVKSKQSLVFDVGQIHSYYCGTVAYFEYGGHADLGKIEVVEGWNGVGTTVLRLGDPRENENHYSLRVRLDDTSNKSGLKVVQMDNPGWGTWIDCRTSIGNSIVATARPDVFDFYGGCSAILSGGPYYPNSLRMRDATGYTGARKPHVHFPSGTIFKRDTTPDQCVNLATTSGAWHVSWGECCDQDGEPIAPGSYAS